MKIKNRQQLLAVVAIAGVTFFAGDKLLFTPVVNWWKERSGKIVELRKKVNQGALLLQRGQGIRSRWGQMRTNTLPNDSSVAEQQLLSAFDRWARASRISVTAIAPQWKRDNNDEYMTLDCHVDAYGSLATVSRFLYDIEKDPLALKLETVEIGARDNEGRQISLGLQISGLVLNPQAR